MEQCERISAILDNLLKLASGDFEIEYKVSEKVDAIDAIGVGVYMLADQYRTTMISKNNLEEQNDEKAVLLKEIHHRVKNNLQVITSLLSLQSNIIKNVEMKSIFQNSQMRISAMAGIHEMLYQNNDFSKINYKEYIKQLTKGLHMSFNGNKSNVHFKIDIPPLFLNLDTSIPLGLLINEIITNSLKYGIKDGEKVEINISLDKQSNSDYVLRIGDNGVGFSDEITSRSSNTLGLMLIHELTSQINGKIEKDTSLKGTNYILSFKEINKPAKPLL